MKKLREINKYQMFADGGYRYDGPAVLYSNVIQALALFAKNFYSKM